MGRLFFRILPLGGILMVLVSAAPALAAIDEIDAKIEATLMRAHQADVAAGRVGGAKPLTVSAERGADPKAGSGPAPARSIASKAPIVVTKAVIPPAPRPAASHGTPHLIPHLTPHLTPQPALPKSGHATSGQKSSVAPHPGKH